MTDPNERAAPGATNPPPERPQAILDSLVVYKAAAKWLEDNPVVDSEALSLEATQHRSNLKAAWKAMEDARKKALEPLNAAVNAERAVWKKPQDTVESLEKIVSDRLAAFMRAEDAKRQAALAKAREEEAKARRLAEEAEAKERAAIENAKVGECVDVAAVTRQADAAFEQFEAANAAAKEAFHDRKVQTRGAYDTRATSLRTKETLIVTDRFALAQALAPEYGAEIDEALLTLVRKFRTKHKVLPAGVKAELEKVL